MKAERHATFYSVTDLSSPPQELNRSENGLEFQQDISLPLPKQVVVFSLGSWKIYDEDATILVGIALDGTDAMQELGHIDKKSRCLVWEPKWNNNLAKALIGCMTDDKPPTARLVLKVQGTLQRDAKTLTTPSKVKPLTPASARRSTHSGLHAPSTPTSSTKKASVSALYVPTTPKSDMRQNETDSATSPLGEIGDRNAHSRPEPTTPSVEAVVKQVKGEKKKRARMGVEKTPEGPTPRKRKPSTRVRTLKEVLGNDKSEAQKENLEVGEISPVAKRQKTVKSVNTSDSSAVVVATKAPAKPASTDRGPSKRWGHSMCMVSEAEAVLIGGQGDRQQICKDSIWILDIEKRKWRTPDTSCVGQKPEARMGHSAVYDPTVRSIYIYGGSKNLRWYNDVHVLDLDNMKWQVIKANGKAPTRAYHSATLYRHEVWILGGVFPLPDPQPDGCSNDIHVFSPMEESWYMPIVMGDKPAPRSGHSATLLQDKMVMFGGWDMPYVYSDLYILDLVMVEWSKPEVNGMPPSQRSWHASCALSGNRALIHGGYDGDLALDDSHIFNLDTLTWTAIKLEPSLSSRCGHVSLCLPYRHENEENDEVFVFGGGDNDGAFFDELVGMMIPIQRTNVLGVLN